MAKAAAQGDRGRDGQDQQASDEGGDPKLVEQLYFTSFVMQ